MKEGVIVGYDPGGHGHHGVAILHVRASEDGSWLVRDAHTSVENTLGDVSAWLASQGNGIPIVAVGIDTLTEWNTGEGGWRPADRWLQATYPAVSGSVVSPNSLYGAMAVNGAAFLYELGSRFRADHTMITEAHPKVCYYALTGEKYDYAANASAIKNWLWGKLGATPTVPVGEHAFDACIGALAALRGLNREWTLDLHHLSVGALHDVQACGASVRFAGDTHYWWPAPAGA